MVFSWMLNGKPIVQDENINIAAFGKKVSVLNIDNISEEQAGNYTCIASNKAGMASHSSELIVKGIIRRHFLFCFIFNTNIEPISILF